MQADFTGGSTDNVEDAIRLLDKSGRPYLLITVGGLNNFRVTSHTTTVSRQLLHSMLESGVLHNYIEGGHNED